MSGGVQTEFPLKWPTTQEELTEQIAEDAFAAHIEDEKRNEAAREVLDAIKDAGIEFVFGSVTL